VDKVDSNWIHFKGIVDMLQDANDFVEVENKLEHALYIKSLLEKYIEYARKIEFVKTEKYHNLFIQNCLNLEYSNPVFVTLEIINFKKEIQKVLCSPSIYTSLTGSIY
jgi:hypothetical protein